jgi:uncharacterized protein YecT (DUF1311 family)
MRILCSMFLVLVFSIVHAKANTVSTDDLDALNGCLLRVDRDAASPELHQSCVGTISTACMGADNGDASPGRQIECYDRERAIWDSILNASYKQLATSLDGQRARKLRDMQNSWITTRDLTCGFYYDYFLGSMAYPMVSFCNNRETARRAIFLRIFASGLPQARSRSF